MCGNLKWILRLWSVSALTHTRHYHSKAMDARMHTSSHPINSRQLFPFCSLSFLFIQFSHFTIRPFPYYHYNSRNGICDVFFFTYSSHSIQNKMCEWRNWFLFICFAKATEMNGKGRDSSHWSSVLSHQQEIIIAVGRLFFSPFYVNRRNTTGYCEEKTVEILI